MQTPLYSPTFNMSMSVPGSACITRPAFGNGNTTGTGTGSIDGIAASVCSWNFPNTGSGNYFYNNGNGFTSISPLISYSGGANRYMRIKYTVDFVYNGSGGTYFFTFPLTGELVPEPTSTLALALGFIGLVAKGRRPPRRSQG